MATERTDFSPFWTAWDQRLRREVEARRARAEERRRRASALVPRMAERLVRGYGARKVTLIGSLARGSFGEASDIDLVVEGLPSDALFRAGAELERLAEDIPVDLIPIESATPRLRAALEEEGVVVDVPR